jgi:hypothetical protein
MLRLPSPPHARRLQPAAWPALWLGLLALLAGCASTPPDSGGATAPARPVSKADIPFSSPECLAAKLRQGEPFPASAIPPAALASRQSGWVAVRYDVLGGSAQNLAVVASEPPGLYDAAALQHAAKYRDPGKTNVRGCVTTIEVTF